MFTKNQSFRMTIAGLSVLTVASVAGMAPPEQDVSSPVEGFTEPYADIRLAASEMGTLASVAVKEGDSVKAGQVMASLDDQVLRVSLEVAKASMEAQGPLNSARAELEAHQLELGKLMELRERNHASQKEVDRVANEVKIAMSRLLSVQEDLKIKALEYRRIEAQLRQRQVRSPIDGVVTEVFKDHGEFVSPGDPGVARIVQLDPLIMVFSVPVQQRGAIREGQSVGLRIGESGAEAMGTVEYVSRTADGGSGTYRVKVRLPNPDQKWVSGEKSVLVLDSSSELAAAETRKHQTADRRPR